jgi:hypothetical protein
VTGQNKTLDALMLNSPGVAYNPPPLAALPDIRKAIDSAMGTLSPGKSVALVGIVQGDGAGIETNAAIVVKAGDDVNVIGWIGKSWKAGGGVSYGAAVKWEL